MALRKRRQASLVALRTGADRSPEVQYSPPRAGRFVLGYQYDLNLPPFRPGFTVPLFHNSARVGTELQGISRRPGSGGFGL